ncbi:hypothetical protein F4818DRAFT_6493 [Hypoxylon cercidicola]|nr:hypothetical protein F4818DRAFT_6493 [Hypoxylon cercidicola]
MAKLLSAAVFITAVRAMALGEKLPEPTNAGNPSPTFQQPEITLPPSFRELVKRQDEAQTVLVAPDNTCGFVDGRPGAVYSCVSTDATCALVTVSQSGGVACCVGGDCGIRVACVDYRDFRVSSACDVGCIQDVFTVKCTNSRTPYCGTMTFFDGIMDYYCDTLSYSTPQQLYTTYDGEDDGRVFTPIVLTLSDDSSTTTTRPNPSPTTLSDSNDDDEDATSTESAAVSSATSAGNSNAGSHSSHSSTNVGAIAGGVVGGVVVLALLGVGLFFLIRHNKKKKAAAAAAAAAGTQPPMTQPPQGPMPPGAGGYQQQDPHYSQQYAPQPPPQGYYPDASKPGGFASVAPTLVPDRNNSTSPISQFTDGRQSYQPTSPTSTVHSNWQQQTQTQPNVPPTVHEAGGNVVGERDYNANHHGQLHELG